MKYGLMDFLSLIGSLGLFLFGMKIMSEALQKAAGSRMRQILATMTSNRFKGVLTGFLITALIQSSSATTVMIVSFVNAGLLSLIESIGVIMGANIGTTVTAWIISILGFNLKISVLSLPLIGIGFPFLFAKSNKTKYWGEFIIGFAFLFLGLEFLKTNVPDIRSNPEILAFLQNYTGMGIGSTLLFVFLGTILTVIIQSSSATMALTLVMCNNGWIPFEIAAAMVLGENIGTTITANIAAVMGNVSSKRAARAHFIFNIIGVIWIVTIMPLFLKAITAIMTGSGLGSPMENVASIPVGLSIFHSSFNIINTILLIGMARVIERIVTWMVPMKEDDEEFRLKYISFGLLTTSEMSILQAKSEINHYSRRVARMFGFLRRMFNATTSKEREKFGERIAKYEKISDNIEVEIANYLTRILENRDITGISSKRIRSMFKIIDEIESIADSCYNIMRTIERKGESKSTFTQDQRNNINRMFELVEQALDILNENIELGYKHIVLDKAQEIENKINELRNELKAEHLRNIEKKKYSYLAGIYYNDIFCEAEKMGDHIINISESIYEILHPATS
ncbi:MAG: Na/Pi cotransporter family protein [Bacteroidales bacterium]|jgi:phosphate:Na+ symporter|nr:Na/Pi cotransporter family protein [Bacteroidales bacterium]